MRVLDLKRARFVLAFALAVLVGGSSSLAATNSASALKIGEVRDVARQSLYSAAPLFALTIATPEQRALVVAELAKDGSSQALESLAEIAASGDEATAKAAFYALMNARPASAHALRLISQLSYDETRRAAARESAQGLALNAPARSSQAFDGVDLGFAQKLLNQRDLRLAIPVDLSNGARYQIQTWFLKRILSLQHAGSEERRVRFDFLVNEIAQFIAKPAVSVKIEKEDDLEAFKETLQSRYAYLDDEMKFSKGLSDQSPVRLEIAPAMYPKVRAMSDSFRQMDQKLDALGGCYFFDSLSEAKLPGFLFRLRLKTQTEQEKLSQLRDISNAFLTKYESLQTVAPKLIENKVIQFANPAEQRFFELMITHYFSTYTFDETSNVMKSVIERPDHQSGTDLFHLMVMYAGPQMQKLLQVVSRRPGISPELQATFKKLEESGFGSAWERVAPGFAQPPEGTEWVKLDHQARVGSMAETYKGVVRTQSGQDVTIAARTLKTDIRDRVEKEIPRLMELGRVIDHDPILRHYDFPLVGPVMDDVMAMSRAELNVALTIQSQQMGERIYTAKKVLKNGVTVEFQTAKTFKAAHPDVIYSTWLQGEKFEDFVARDPGLAVQIAELTAYHWIENALFKERFFHADLHQGNLKIQKRGANDYVVGLLDFGMVGSLSLAERSTIIKLSLATARNTNPALIAKYLFDLSEKDKNTVTFEQLREEAKTYLALNKGPLLTMDVWLSWSLSRGLKLPKNITAFSRGIGAMEQLTIASGSKKWLAEMVKDVALQHKMELAPDLARYLRDSVVSSVSEATRKLRPIAKAPSVRAPMTCSDLFGH